MSKTVICDICGKDITEEYDSEDNTVLSYDYKVTMDLCDKCLKKYEKVKDKVRSKYDSLCSKYIKKRDEEITKYYQKEISKIKEK